MLCALFSRRGFLHSGTFGALGALVARPGQRRPPRILLRSSWQVVNSGKGLMWRDIGLGEWLFEFDREAEIKKLVPTMLAMRRDRTAAQALVSKAREFRRTRQEETMATGDLARRSGTTNVGIWPVLRHLAGRRAEADGQGSRRDDSPLRRKDYLEDPLPQRQRTLPHFVETFMDNGYYDMWTIMKALRDVDVDGIVILDHSPAMVGGNHTQTAYGSPA